MSPYIVVLPCNKTGGLHSPFRGGNHIAYHTINRQDRAYRHYFEYVLSVMHVVPLPLYNLYRSVCKSAFLQYDEDETRSSKFRLCFPFPLAPLSPMSSIYFYFLLALFFPCFYPLVLRLLQRTLYMV